MSELRSSTETTDPATTDAPQHGEASPGAGYDRHRAAQAAEDRLPLRQDDRTGWDDDPGYDEADLADEYGDLEALMADDRLPPRQASGTVNWDDDPWYDEAGLAAEYDGDLDSLTADGHATATGEEHAPDGGEGDQAAPDDVPPATAEPGDPPAEPPATSAEAAPGQEDGNVTAPGSSPVGAAADTGSVADAGTGEQPDEASQPNQADAPAGQAAQPDDSHANPDTAPEASPQDLQARYEASLKDLEARYEARMKGLENEVQALKDHWQSAPDVPGSSGRDADQPRVDNRELPAAQAGAGESKDEHDRPGPWSNAKTALYGAVGTVGTAAVLGEYFPGVSPVIAGVAAGAVTIASTLVPVLRERRRREHDNPPDKP
jgi:hypothetical protein